MPRIKEKRCLPVIDATLNQKINKIIQSLTYQKL